MKTRLRVLLTAAVMLIAVIVAWSGALAANGSLRNTSFSRLFQVRSDSAQIETETPQAVEDTSGQHQADDTTQAASLEPGDDSQVQHESAGTLETGDDSQVVHESAGTPEANREVTGVVTAINGNTVTVDGVAYSLSSGVEGASSLQVGQTVKLEFTMNADGTVSVREIKSADQALSSDGSGSSSSSDQQGSSSGSEDSGGKHGDGSGGGSGSGDGGGDSGGSGG